MGGFHCADQQMPRTGSGSSGGLCFSFSQRKKYLLAHHGLDLCLEHYLWGWREIDVKVEIEKGEGRGKRKAGREREGYREGEMLSLTWIILRLFSGPCLLQYSSCRNLFLPPVPTCGEREALQRASLMEGRHLVTEAVMWFLVFTAAGIISTNYHLAAKPGPLPDFVNKVLLEHSHTHSLTNCLWLFSHYSGRGE